MKLFACSVFLFTILWGQPQNSSAQSFEDFEDEILLVVNKHRLETGLNPLVMLVEVKQQAQIHSKNMANRKVKFGHKGFSKRTKIIRESIGGNAFAENVAYGQESAQEVFDSWLNSPGHRKNIEGDFTKTGIGVAVSKNGTYYFTQIFIK